MKKRIALALALVMLVAAFSACANSGAPTSTTSTSTSTGTTPDSSTPEKPLKITWLPYNQAAGILPDANSEMKQYLEEKYNIEIEIVPVNVHKAEEWNLFWATGKAPDFSQMNNSTAAVFKLADQGLVRDIPEGWLDQYMPDCMNTMYAFMDKDILQGQISNGGKTYVLPWKNPTPGYIMGIRKDWLDNLGITNMPTTPDEMFEILKKFTFDDPDQNGQKDTYGIHGGSGTTYMRFGYVHNYFGQWPGTYYNIDGKVTFTGATENYKDQLKYLNNWFKAGVIDPEFATEDRTVQRKKWAEGRFGVIVDNPWWFAQSTPGNLTDMLKEANPDAEIAFLEPFKDANGEQKVQGYLPTISDGSGFFGINCSDEVMQKVMQIKNDLTKDIDFYTRAYYGVEGRDYDVVDGKVVARPDATKAEYVTEKGIRQTFGLAPLTKETTAKYFLSAAEEELYNFTYQFGIQYADRDFNFSGVNESNTLYGADIKTVFDEFYFNAITSKVDIDKDWDKYLKDLDTAGLQKVIDEYQAGLIQ